MGCGRVTYQHSRGVCRHACYSRLNKKVLAGVYTWRDLARRGLCLPTREELAQGVAP
jgi:hypothetical protein